MEEKKTTDVLKSVLARLYEQLFLLDKTASDGQMIKEGELSKVHSFNEWCATNLAPCYEGDDVTLFLQKISSEAITSVLTYEDEYVVDFSVVEDQIVRRKSMKVFECKAEELVCVAIEDITSQYTKAQSRERIARDSVEMAQRVCMARDAFFRNMSDELRLPVAQTVEILEASLQKEEADVKGYINKAVTKLKKYSNTIDGLSSLSAIEKGVGAKRDEVIFTVDFINDLKQMVALQTDAASPVITVGCNANKMMGFLSDRLRLKQLIGNALSMMLLESTDKTAEATYDFEIRKETEYEEGVFDFLFVVRAKGIEEFILQDPVMRFVQRLVFFMDGIMTFETSEEDAELTIRIPVQYADKECLREAKVEACMTDSIGNRDMSAFRALVVDDDEIGREITVSQLEQFGLTVETASDGVEAKEKLLASPARYYQIVFMKMYLPKKSGLELTMELRELTRRDLNDITIVTVTSNPLRDDRLVALEHGMDHHLVLPFNDIELNEILLRELEDIGPEEAHEKFGFRILK